MTPTELEEIAKTMGALASTNRLRILIILSAHEQLTPTQLAGFLTVKDSLVTHHLGDLVNAGLVSRSPSGRNVFYSLNRDTFQALSSALSSIYVKEPANAEQH